MSDVPRDPAEGTDPFARSNPFSDNPYAAPQMPSDGMPESYGVPTGRGMVGHVTLVAIMMIVQSALEIVMGLFMVGMGVAMPFFLQMQGSKNMPPGFSADSMSWVMFVMYGGLGIVTLVAAALHLVAGIRNYQFRNRTLGLVALIGGMVTLFTCYCAPTSVALGVYGLITYLNAEVGQAFEMGAAGSKRSEILTTFGL